MKIFALKDMYDPVIHKMSAIAMRELILFNLSFDFQAWSGVCVDKYNYKCGWNSTVEIGRAMLCCRSREITDVNTFP